MQNKDNHTRSLKIQIKEVVTESAVSSSFIGVSKIIKGEIYIKLIWIFFHLSLMGIATFLITNNILSYLNYSVTTQVRQINTIPINYPTVTLCNINTFLTNYSVDFLRQVGKTFHYVDIFNSSDAYNTYYSYNLTSSYTTAGFASVISQNLNKQELQKLSRSIDDMILFCQFNLADCGPQDFVWYFHPYYGNCYQFNNDPTNLKKVVQAGSSGGLILELFIGVPKILEMITYDSGLAVFIHSNTTLPLSVQPVMVSPNEETSIAIFKIKTKKQPQPYSECQDISNYNSELVDLIMSKGHVYYQQDCIIQCYQKILYENCSCYDLNFPNFFDSPPTPNYCYVMNESYINCYENTYHNVFFSNDFIDSHCVPLCPLECETTEFDKSVSFNAYPTPYYEFQLLQSGNLEGIYDPSQYSQPLRNNIAIFNIYFDSLSYTMTTESPSISLITLISNIGGSIGLMLGVSFATVIEIVELTVKILVVILRNRRNKKPSAKNPNNLDN